MRVSTTQPPPKTVIESHPDGDATNIDVRLVIAPHDGRFLATETAAAPVEGGPIQAGALIGHVVRAGTPAAVRSFCAGVLVRLLAEPDEQVRAGQPLAWIRAVGP